MMEAIIQKILQDKNRSVLVRQHGLETYLYDRGIEEFENAFKKNALRADIYIENIEKIARVAKEKKIELVFLKGFAIERDLYCELGQRFKTDVDILVDSEDMQKLGDILENIGFKKNQKISWFADDFKVEYQKIDFGMDITIEVHTKLFFHHHQKLELVDFHPYGKRLSPEMEFLHLCGHYVFQHTFSNLYWLNDLHLYWRKYKSKLDLIKLEELARQFKLKKSLESVLYLLGENSKKRFWFKLLRHDFLISPHKKRTHFLLVKILCKDNLLSSLKYLLFWPMQYYRKKKHQK